MKLRGLTSNTSSPATCTREVSTFSSLDHLPRPASRPSTTQKPMLCRVSAYRGPGFPRPTTTAIGDVARGSALVVGALGGLSALGGLPVLSPSPSSASPASSAASAASAASSSSTVRRGASTLTIVTPPSVTMRGSTSRRSLTWMLSPISRSEISIETWEGSSEAIQLMVIEVRLCCTAPPPTRTPTGVPVVLHRHGDGQFLVGVDPQEIDVKDVAANLVILDLPHDRPLRLAVLLFVEDEDRVLASTGQRPFQVMGLDLEGKRLQLVPRGCPGAWLARGAGVPRDPCRARGAARWSVRSSRADRSSSQPACSTFLKYWLPGEDSNLDRRNQNPLSYQLNDRATCPRPFTRRRRGRTQKDRKPRYSQPRGGAVGGGPVVVDAVDGSSAARHRMGQRIRGGQQLAGSGDDGFARSTRDCKSLCSTGHSRLASTSPPRA